MAVTGSLLGDAWEKLAREIQQWGESHIANPIRSSAVNIHAFGQRNVADPARAFAEYVQQWGKKNIADPTRDALTTSDGRNAVAAFWGDLLNDWVNGPNKDEVRRIAQQSGTSVDAIVNAIDLMRTGPGRDSTINSALRDLQIGNVTGPVQHDSVAGSAGINTPDPRREGGVTTAQDGATQPTGSTPTGGGGGGAGGGGGGFAGGGGGGGTVDTGLPEEGTARQIPGGAQLWRVDGKTVYLAYTIPGTDKWMVWHVENPDRLNAIYGDQVPAFDKDVSRAEFARMSPWRGGLSAELQNTDEEPWQQFMSDFNAAAELRPWLKDPTVQAVMAVAYLEGRAPTSDELSVTDWWQDHTADERAWMEESATLGREEVQRRRDDASAQVAEALRKSGMTNAPQTLVDYIAEQRLTGKWSETYANEQIRKLADPFAPGTLDRGLLAVVRDPGMGSSADARAIAEGKDALKERIRAIFDNARIDLSKHSDGTTVDPEERLDRMATEVLSGARTMSDIRHSVDLLAAKTPGGRVGGLDVTAEGEDHVRDLATRWLGPVVGQLDDRDVREWAGRIRNDPDSEQEFIEYLQEQRLAILPGYTNRNLTYENIIQPVRNLATNIWGQHVDDETLLVDLANMGDYTEMAARLRHQGLEKGVGKVVDDALAGLSETALGQQVVRSAV